MSEQLAFKDHNREARIFTRRMLVSVALIVGLLGILIARFYNLQVVHHQNYVTQSERNRVLIQAIPPTRGLIYDRNGELLADNRPSYALSIIKERVSSLDDTVGLLRSLVNVSDDDVEKFHKQMQQPRRPFEAVPLRYSLNEDEIARIAVNEYRLDGVEVEARLVRHYPQSHLLAHNVGYVGRINEKEQGAFDEELLRRYSGTHMIGKVGLEKHYESLLLGQVGRQHVETNARGQVLRVLERIDPTPGENLMLYLDAHMQRVAYEALGEKRGAVVAMDVKTGGVLAMVSTPSYDPNLFVTGISHKDYNRLNQSKDLPLFNRTLQGQYPPGSTLKPMLGLAGLQKRVISGSYHIRDPGYYQLEGKERFYRDWKKRGHGNKVNLAQAIEESCDTFFYGLAFKLGIDNMHSFGKQFGLGRRSGIDVPSERTGLWPSREWKKANRGLPWFPGDSLNAVIGQGDVLTTPLQLAAMTATLANRGEYKRPRMVKKIGHVEHVPETFPLVEADEGNWDYIVAAMRSVVHGLHGTAQGIRRGGLKYRIAGKTGTAQVVGIKQDEEYDSEKLKERQRDHALFVAFAPVNAPEVAVAVIVENGEHGSSSAAPVARKVLDAYMIPPVKGQW